MTAVFAQDMVIGWGTRRVVSHINIELPRGESMALVGTNGSGKSTLLRTLAGLQPTLAGRLRVLDGHPGSQPRRVAYVGQFHPRGFVLPLRVRDVVTMGRFPARGLFGFPRRQERVVIGDAMEQMQVADLADRPLRDLSGGQQQRVYVAQALAWQADLLLLDEPAAGLDVAAQELLSQALERERSRGASVISATHDIRDAARSDQAILLAGRVVAAGPSAEVLRPDTVRETFGLVSPEGLEGLEVPVDSHHCAHDHEHEHPTDLVG